MKTGWRQFATRKDKLETIALRSEDFTDGQAAVAWRRLTQKMLDMSSPESPRLPKFNDLLLAIVVAQCRAKGKNLYAIEPEAQPFKPQTHLCGDQL